MRRGRLAVLCVLCTLCVLGAERSAKAQSAAASRPGTIVDPKPSAPDKPKAGDPNKGTGVIRGKITLANGRPAVKASIQLSSNGPAHATAADENGDYEFTELPADSFYLSAGKAGYLILEYGQRHAFERGDPIELKDGETRTKVDVTLLPGGAVSGRVVDETGDPVENVTVRLFQVQYFSNRRQLLEIAQAGGRTTDDTGAFRLYGVPPGDYVVRASVTDRLPAGGGTAFNDTSGAEKPAADLPGYAPTFFPGTIVPSDAQLVRVGLSQEVTGVDFALTAVPTARISGVALSARNQPTGVVLNRTQRSGAYGERPIRAAATNDGFHFDNVAPGEYVLQTTGSIGPGSNEPDFAFTYVTVNGANISDIRLQATAGSRIEGTVRFDGLAADTKAPQVQITAWPVDFERAPMSLSDIAFARVANDGSFSIQGVQGPRRIQLAQAPRGWQIKSVRANGQDITDEVIAFGTRDSLSVQIVLTRTGPGLAGKGVDDQGRDSHEYSVVAFSTDPDRWYQRSRFMATVKGRSDGTFAIPGLGPGEYYVAAVSSLLNPEGWGEWQDPEFLKKLTASATRVTLADGQTASLALRVIQR